jgi:hypothetical protein
LPLVIWPVFLEMLTSDDIVVVIYNPYVRLLDGIGDEKVSYDASGKCDDSANKIHPIASLLGLIMW